MLRRYLICLCVFGFSPVFGQKGNFDAIREKISTWRTEARGPYQDIRWFCEDGTTKPAKEPCTKGEGVQRARHRPEVISWGKQLHFFPAQILAATKKDDFWDESADQARFKQYQIDKFLRDNDNGWILEKAQFYRGAFQAEDEQEWGKDFLIWLLAKPGILEEHYFLLRQIVKTIPHEADTPQSQRMRALSKELADSYTAFMNLRVKIHGQPGWEDIGETRRFLEQHKDKLDSRQLAKMSDLIETMEAFYRFDPYQVICEQLTRIPARHPIAKWTDAYLQYFGEDSGSVAQLSATSDLMRDIRDGLPSLERASHRLAALEIGLLLEQILYRTGYTDAPIPAQQLMENICYLEQATAASGYLADWEWISHQRDQWSVADSMSMPLGGLLFNAEQSRRILEWSVNTVRAVYQSDLELFSAIEPKAQGFTDDLVRSSLLLPLGRAVERFSNFVSKEAALKNDIAVLGSPSSMRGLNPGFAKGQLVVVSDYAEDIVIDNQKIYIFDHPPADLKPIAGIATVSEGNMVSHVQLLARNLGIPNAVLSTENLHDLEKWHGEEVFYAVSPRGTVIIKPDAKMTETEAALFAVKTRAEEKIEVPLDRMELQTRRVINLRELDASSSGRWCGPKAANLGQLKQLFPDNVVEGIVVPFGIFKGHMEQPMPQQGRSYWGYLQAGFKMASQMEASGKSENQVQAALLLHLDTLRQALKTIPFLPGFQQEFRDSFAQIIGQPMGKIPVFLRSDTNMEDLKDFTGAGLNLTLFNVLEEEKIWQGIRDVWASAYTERSFKWRQRYLTNPENVYPSLLVIPGVNVDYSGVVITKGVASGKPNDITAAFSRGVGGAVDGQRAETYIIYESGHIQLVSPAREMKYTYLPATGGTTKRTANLQQPVLNLSNLTAIFKLTKAVETRFPNHDNSAETPVYDIELGFQNDILWLFQVRPFVENKKAAATDYLQTINPYFSARRAVDLSQKI